MDYQDMANKIIAQAKKKGIADNLFFIATFMDYQKLRKMLKELSDSIDEKKIFDERGNVNKSVSEFQKVSQSASNIALKLFKMLGCNISKTKNKKNKSDDKNKITMPDFEMCSPTQLKKWCDHFDIDPTDYAKSYLYKALEKRWKFEYGD